MVMRYEIIVGTYEQFMLGYKMERNDARYSIKQTFATRSHTGSIRAVAGCERYLASAGSDDRVFVYDMSTRKEIQMLMHHKGTVNTIGFTPKASHIITGSADGAIAVIRTGNWQIEKLWGSAHKQASVNNIAIHPTGKMALSIGGDYILRTWNLVKGRHAYATNLASRGPNGKLADTIQWSPNGVLFTITGSKMLEIWSIEQAEVIDSIEFEAKVVTACWISDTSLLCGLEDGNLCSYDSQTKKNKNTKAHNCRVKCVAAVEDYIVTCDSSGVIKIWSNYTNEDITEMCTINASCRITCITLVDTTSLKKEKEDIKKVVEHAQVEENNKDDSDSDEIETAVDNQPMELKNEVVIVEEEINNIRGPLEDINQKMGKNRARKNKKKQKINIEDEIISPIKQTKMDGVEVGMAEDPADILNVKSKKNRESKVEITEHEIRKSKRSNRNMVLSKSFKRSKSEDIDDPCDEATIEKYVEAVVPINNNKTIAKNTEKFNKKRKLVNAEDDIVSPANQKLGDDTVVQEDDLTNFANIKIKTNKKKKKAVIMQEKSKTEKSSANNMNDCYASVEANGEECDESATFARVGKKSRSKKDKINKKVKLENIDETSFSPRLENSVKFQDDSLDIQNKKIKKNKTRTTRTEEQELSESNKAARNISQSNKPSRNSKSKKYSGPNVKDSGIGDIEFVDPITSIRKISKKHNISEDMQVEAIINDQNNPNYKNKMKKAKKNIMIEEELEKATKSKKNKSHKNREDSGIDSPISDFTQIAVSRNTKKKMKSEQLSENLGKNTESSKNKMKCSKRLQGKL